MKILIVEDEDILVSVLEEKFQRENFKVSVVRDGSQVLSFVEKNKPDIILLDIILPNINGTEILSSLKSNKEFKNIPVIMLSNLGEDEKIKESLSLGAVDYLIKTDYPINEVVEKVNKYALRSK